jgi:hypothetical protein
LLQWNAVSEIVQLADRQQANNKTTSLATYLQELTVTGAESEADGERDVVTPMTLRALPRPS